MSKPNNQNNFYELFEILPSASTKEIILAYENKITKYNNLRKLTKNQINEIKMYKTGLFILLRQDLRNKYNQVKGICKKTSEPVAGNYEENSTLDSLFNVDNSWMKNNTNNDIKGKGKQDNNINMIGDRVFSMAVMNKRPGYSSDFEAEIRKPQQGRPDKSSQFINES